MSHFSTTNQLQQAILKCVLVTMLVCFVSRVSAQVAPAEWMAVEGQAGVKTFSPKKLGENESLRVACLPLVEMKQFVLLEFTDRFAESDLKSLGATITVKGEATGQSENAATTYRTVRTADGVRQVIYFGISMDRRNARFIRVSVSGDGALLKKYMNGIVDINKQMVELDKKEAVASGRGIEVDPVPTTPKGIKPGGKIVPGIYVGNKVNDDGKILRRYRLYLYDNFEWRLLNDKGEDTYKDSAGKFTYSPASGKLNISYTHDLTNDPRDPDEGFCLFGRDEKGKCIIRAYEDRGIGHDVTFLQLVGQVDLPSPEAEKEAKKQLDAEKDRYKLVVKAGEGLKPDDIAGIYHNYELSTGANSMSGQDSVYLLLSDGTIRDGLPVPADELDVPLSKRREPEVWGRWEKKGAGIVAAWRDRPDKFEAVKGTFALQAKSDEKIVGTFSSGMTTGNMVTGSSWHIWGVTFEKSGRWEKFKRGGFSNGSLAQTLNDTYIFSAYDDEGAVVSASTHGVVVGSSTKKKKGSDRSGTYKIEGWTMILTADDGSVKRIPFFFTEKEKKCIYFEGATLNIDKD